MYQEVSISWWNQKPVYLIHQTARSSVEALSMCVSKLRASHWLVAVVVEVELGGPAPLLQYCLHL